MKTQLLGDSALESTRLIYGCMRTLGPWDPAKRDAQANANAKRAMQTAYDAGYRHFDNADIYAYGECESVLGEWLGEHPGVREELLITTKCGIRWAGDPGADAPHRGDLSGKHIVWSAEQSLKRLGIDTIDVYLLHRPDQLMHPPEVAAAFEQLKKQGKVKRFGVSNFTTAELGNLMVDLPDALVCNQIEFHPGKLSPMEDGTLADLRRLGLTPTVWSPLGGGVFGDSDHPGKDEHTQKVLEALDKEAAALGVSRTVTTLAWLMRHPSGVLPIVGSANPEHIRGAARADDVELSREAWYRIYLAARGKSLP